MHNYTKHEKEYFLTRNIKNMRKLHFKLSQLLSICLLGISTSAFSASDSNEATTSYVDSVYEWGAWELGLEPAAGGPAPSSNQALAVRGPGVNFRPNENSAFAPVTRPVPLPNTPFDATTGTFTPGLGISSGSPADNWR